MSSAVQPRFQAVRQSPVAKGTVVVLVLVALIYGAEVLRAPAVSSTQPIDSAAEVPSITPPVDAALSPLTPLTAAEKEQVMREFPVYGSRPIEQMYLTLPEWYQVYSYNELADFLVAGGRQSDFPFLTSIKNFWQYYGIAVDQTQDEPFNWLYHFVDWMIGLNFTVEYLTTSLYENTVGRVTQVLGGSDTEADRFIADSWDNYAERMYQATWYHYPFFADVKGIWTQTALFDRTFVRSLERKLAFSFSYLIKGSYAQLWLLIAVQKENETVSIVHADDQLALERQGATILKPLANGTYLIETERYAGFKDALLRLIADGVRFVEIQGHDTIALSYLTTSDSELLSSAGQLQILDTRALFFHPDGYTHRVTTVVPVSELDSILRTLDVSGAQFEMIYDY